MLSGLCDHFAIMRVATLNVQNLRLRSIDGQDRLHGAWDSDAPEGSDLDPIDRRLTAELLAEVDADVVRFILEEAGKFCSQELLTINRDGDEHGGS